MTNDITDNGRGTAALQLSKLLADTYSLYLKTHCFHWNVTGPHFHSLHAMFEEQYRALWEAADEIAERIRALDVYVQGSYDQLTRLSSIKDEPGVPEWREMIAQLLRDHETAAATARDVVRSANAAGDDGTADLATGRLKHHEKLIWMLRSQLK